MLQRNSDSKACNFKIKYIQFLSSFILGIFLFTFLKENNLVILIEFHESWNHLRELDDLLDQVGQLLSRRHPELLVSLKQVESPGSNEPSKLRAYKFLRRHWRQSFASNGHL